MNFLLTVLPEIQNYDDLGLKSFLVFVIIIMGLVIFHLYNRVNDLNDKINKLQDDFRSEIIGANEKTISVLPAFEKEIIKTLSDMFEKVLREMNDQHQKTTSTLKETIKDNK